MKIKNIAIIIFTVLSAIIMNESCFIVKQTEQVLIMRLGQYIRCIKEPGLFLMIPFIDEKRIMEKRAMTIDFAELEITLEDKRRVVVDAFGLYEISNPIVFYTTVKNEDNAKSKLLSVLLGNLRSVLGKWSLNRLLSEEKVDAMKSIEAEVNKAAASLGITIISIRIRKTDLPTQNSESIFNRMISERKREATEIRAKGAEIAIKIKSEAEKNSAIAIAEAEKEALELVGEGEAAAIKIITDAFGDNKEFVKFYMSMIAYENSLSKNVTFILNDNHKFLKYFNISNIE